MKSILALAAAVLVAIPVLAQDKAEGSYRVEYTFRDATTGAKAQHFTMILGNNGHGQFRLGHRVPYATGTSPSSTQSGGFVATQWNYLDAGINIDCRLKDVAGRIELHSDIEISSVVLPDKTGGMPVPPSPTVASMRLNVESSVLLGKGTVIASIDDPAAPRKFDVEVAVTHQN